MIWIILTIGIALRLINLNQSLWLDEAINLMAVKSYSLIDLVTVYAKADFHPPGWFIISWLWTKLLGYSEIAARIPSVIFGIVTIYLIFLVGKKLVSKNVGLIAALILSINPLHIYYSQEARMYSFATMAVILNIFLIVKLFKEEKISVILLVISNLLVLFSDYLAYFIFPAEILFLILLKKRTLIRNWLLAFIIAGILFIWWLPYFFGQLDTGSIAAAKLPTWKFVVGGFDFKAVPLTFVKFIIGRISLPDKVMYALILLPVSSFFALLLLKGAKLANSDIRKLLLSWILIPLSIATVISAVIPVFSYFRMLFIIPGFILLVSLGLTAFSRLKKITIVLVITIELFCSLVYLLNPRYQREDWKGLVSFLNDKKTSVVLFESSGTLPPFDYYAQNSITATGALKDFPAKSKEDVVELERYAKSNQEIYLVNYLVEISDPHRFVAAKLASLGYKVKDVINFNGVGFVYYYTK